MVVRSTLLILVSQGFFLVSVFVIHSGLSRLLGPRDYGTYGLVISIIVAVELLVITGIPEVIQKFGGERPTAMAKLKRKTFPWQFFYCMSLTLIFILAAPIVSRIFGDEHLTFYLRIAGIDIFFAGLYRYYLGLQNGLHRFSYYTALGITFSAGKLMAIFLLVWLGLSLTGALIGHIMGSVFGLALGMLLTRIPETAEELDPIPYFSFIIQNVLYFVGLNLLFSIDLWFVKIHVGGADVGYYTAAAVFGKVPYLLSVALSAVLLPSLSLAIKKKDDVRVKELTRQFIRLLFLFLVLLDVIVIPNSGSIIRLFFGTAYQSSAEILSILLIGLSFVTLLAVMNTIMIANNLMRSCFVLLTILVILDAGLNAILVPKYHTLGAAAATSIVGLIGCIAGIAYIWDDIKAFVLSFSFPRLLFIASIVVVLFSLQPFENIHILIKSVIITVFFFLLLIMTKELSMADLKIFRESLFLPRS